jgi:outer membrane protein assembly factor BamB
MGLRVAILLAVIGGLALVGGIAFVAVPNRRGPRLSVLATASAILIVAIFAVVLAPISAATQAPVNSNLSLYLLGHTCESAPPTLSSDCAPRPHELLDLRATDGAARWNAPASVAQNRTNSAFVGAPILRDGTIYALYRVDGPPGSDPATLLALRATDGREIWRASLDSTPLAMQVADGQVYVLMQDREDASLLRSFNASDGAPGRQFSVPILAGFVVTNGLIIGCDAYFYSSPSTVTFLAYHASDGSLAWQESPPGAHGGEPRASCVLALGNGVLYQASYNGAGVTAVRVSDGKPLWTAQVESVAALALSGDQLIAVASPTVFSKFGQPPLASDSEKIMALNLADGHTLWQRAFPGAKVGDSYTYATIALDENRVFVATTGALRSLRLRDGATLWELKSNLGNDGFSGQFYAYPVVAQKTLFVEHGFVGVEPTPERRAAQQTHILALNVETGAAYWSVPVYSTGFVLGAA